MVGRPKLHITLNNIGFHNGTKEAVLLLYPSLTFSAAIRKIVDAHLHSVTARSSGERTYSSDVDRLLEANPIQIPSQTEKPL